MGTAIYLFNPNKERKKVWLILLLITVATSLYLFYFIEAEVLYLHSNSILPVKFTLLLGFVKVFLISETIVIYLFISRNIQYKSIEMHLFSKFFSPLLITFITLIFLSDQPYQYPYSSISIPNTSIKNIPLEYIIGIFYLSGSAMALISNRYLIRKYSLTFEVQRRGLQSLLFASDLMLVILIPASLITFANFPSVSFELSMIVLTTSLQTLIITLIAYPEVLFHMKETLAELIDSGNIGWGILEIEGNNPKLKFISDGYLKRNNVTQKSILAFETSVLTALAQKESGTYLRYLSIPFPFSKNHRILFLPIYLPDKNGRLRTLLIFMITSPRTQLNLSALRESEAGIYRLNSKYESLNVKYITSPQVSEIISPLIR